MDGVIFNIGSRVYDKESPFSCNLVIDRFVEDIILKTSIVPDELKLRDTTVMHNASI